MIYDLNEYLEEHKDEYDLHDLSVKTIVELMGESKWHEDNLEDLQHYIDRAAYELECMCYYED